VEKSKLVGLNINKDGEYFYSTIGPRTEDYIQKKYNLNIEEILENINKLHYYKVVH